MKSNILFICQNRNKQKILGNALADELGMFYADLNDIMEYNFIDKKTLQFSGKEYYENQVYKSIKSAKDYENSVITVNFDSLNIKDAWQQLKTNSLVIYLRESYEPYCDSENENKVNELVFEDRDLYIQEKTDIIVENLENSEDCLQKIFIAMEGNCNESCFAKSDENLPQP